MDSVLSGTEHLTPRFTQKLAAASSFTSSGDGDDGAEDKHHEVSYDDADDYPGNSSQCGDASSASGDDRKR